MSNEAVLVLPTQLFEKHPLLQDEPQTVFLVEFERYFSAFNFHKQKLILHRATMQMYKKHLEDEGHTVIYIEHDDANTFPDKLKKKKVQRIKCLDPTDTPFEAELKKMATKAEASINFYDTPLFLTPKKWIKTYFKDKDTYRQHGFYKAQRKRLDVLMTKDGQPKGGKWSFDKDNRESLPEDITIPEPYKPQANTYQTEAETYIEKHFADNYGNGSNFFYPTTYYTAQKWLDDFLKKRFSKFGPYQDAIAQDELILFHSVLSPMLNIGLLTPKQVLDETLSYAKDHKVPINSLEGFIRQLIGWREFIRAVYILAGQKEREGNFFNHRRHMRDAFWDGTTGIAPVDDAIHQALDHAYNHHILRLMILGNFMLLCKIKPDHVYKWFMSLFIDAYDWVMVPNVYGMSQYADGGLMTTKPYISGSNYVRKMSNYKKGDWCDVWDALYWNFIDEHKQMIKDTPRLAVMYGYLKNMKASTIKEHKKTADAFINKLD